MLKFYLLFVYWVTSLESLLLSYMINNCHVDWLAVPSDIILKVYILMIQAKFAFNLNQWFPRKVYFTLMQIDGNDLLC